MHGGTVQARSSGEGEGGTFTLVLPLVNNVASNPVGVASPNRRGMGRRKNEKNDRSLLINTSSDRQSQQIGRSINLSEDRGCNKVFSTNFKYTIE